MKNIGKLIFGIVILVLGLLLLIQNLGIVTSIPFADTLKIFWPIGIILAGVLILVKQRLLGTTILILSIVFGIVFTALPTNMEVGELKIENRDYPSENVSEVIYDISFGGANLNLTSSNDKTKLIEIKSETTIQKDLNFKVNEKNGITYVNIEEEGYFTFFDLFNLKDQVSNLDIKLNPDINTKLNLDYGAVDGVLDLRELNIEKLKINSGASSTQIYLGSYPTLIEIDTGASDIQFHFPEGIEIEIENNGGASSTQFSDFKKVGNKYYSPNFEDSEEKIIIKIDSGVSSITGEVIKNE